MTEAKHTAGPWVVTQRDGQAAIQGPATEWIAALPYAPCEGFGLTSVVEVNANALLIAAAPAMLEALIALGTVLDFDFEAPPCGCFEDASALNAAMAKGRAAIAKARGG